MGSSPTIAANEDDYCKSLQNQIYKEEKTYIASLILVRFILDIVVSESSIGQLQIVLENNRLIFMGNPVATCDYLFCTQEIRLV